MGLITTRKSVHWSKIKVLKLTEIEIERCTTVLRASWFEQAGANARPDNTITPMLEDSDCERNALALQAAQNQHAQTSEI
jgi:hypothetical protein